jgi:acyl carrier protein
LETSGLACQFREPYRYGFATDVSCVGQRVRGLFPRSATATLRQLSIENTETWDSVGTVTLVNVIEEEFGIEIAINDGEHLSSYASLLAYLSECLAFQQSP